MRIMRYELHFLHVIIELQQLHPALRPAQWGLSFGLPLSLLCSIKRVLVLLPRMFSLRRPIVVPSLPVCVPAAARLW